MNFIINGKLSGLNEYTKANRSNPHEGNKMKRINEQIVATGLIIACSRGEMRKVKNYPISLNITWYEQNARRDIDNITFAVKFILDTLVKRGMIIDDSQKYVKSISHKVLVDKEYPRVEVEIYENK